MVDFKKRLSGKTLTRPTNPIDLYETLDRAHDKGPLRPAQTEVLKDWQNGLGARKDVIVKLHTGQGKTLIGLLMLQSQLNAAKGPAVYLCPDNYLIEQTCEQARQFGIPTCQAEPELPEDFLASEKILVTSVQKLFNGLTKFGLNRRSIKVGTLLMDDAHACSDRIREACRIRIPSEDQAYAELRRLFSTDLESQGLGTYSDICNDKREAFLPVPYWAWAEHQHEVAQLLSRMSDHKCLRFVWPLLKDMLHECQCVVSGSAIEIEPYVAPLSMFGSYASADHRIFMSATVTDDAFLVRGLQLKPETILNPLTYSKERWSGEKMVLIPALIHESLDREALVEVMARPRSKRRQGLVALTPGFAWTRDWEKYGASVATKETLGNLVADLKRGECEQAIVLANRYDGIDLPDDTCRVLVFDSKPFSESLIDLYEESCRPDSEATVMKTIRTVEQGMGRSVRGEKDYSVVMMIGADLTRLVRDRTLRKHLSPQTSKQIDVGLEIAGMAKKEVEEGVAPFDALQGLIRQCAGRDDDWKAFYVEQMDLITENRPSSRLLETYATELDAERFYSNGDYSSAVSQIQNLLDNNDFDHIDRAWYLQTMARYSYSTNRPESVRLQISAHSRNRMLLKPPSGVTVAKLQVMSQGRVERVIEWVAKFETYAELDVRLSEILGRLRMGTKAERFESALDEISFALGFVGERPDKEWKEGPDNLWALDAQNYLLFECKSEVEDTRSEINKRESDQMNRSSAWFLKHYQGMAVKRILIHPTNVEASAASFTDDVEVMRAIELNKLVKRIREFFKSFESQNFKDLSTTHIQGLIESFGLSVYSLKTDYSKKIRVRN